MLHFPWNRWEKRSRFAPIDAAPLAPSQRSLPGDTDSAGPCHQPQGTPRTPPRCQARLCNTLERRDEGPGWWEKGREEGEVGEKGQPWDSPIPAWKRFLLFQVSSQPRIWEGQRCHRHQHQGVLAAWPKSFPQGPVSSEIFPL